jgi:hypothetical protein
MGDLLASVLEVHGGVDRWARVRTVTARLSIGGSFWGRKGWPEIFGDQTTLELDARRQHIVVTPFNCADRRSTVDVNPERIVVHTNDGIAVDRRDDPRASFAGYEVTTPWDALQVGYFISYASWNYLTAPFLFPYPGVETRELEPWQEDGETWRRLHVTFPRSIATHGTEQVFYYGADLMQRRMDYAVEVNGGVLTQYQYEPRTFRGLVFPTQRRVHRRSPDGTADQSQTSITLDLTDIAFDFEQWAVLRDDVEGRRTTSTRWRRSHTPSEAPPVSLAGRLVDAATKIIRRLTAARNAIASAY